MLVNEFLWTPIDKNGKRFDVDIKIKTYMNSRGKITATPSHMVKTPNLASPYMSLEEKDTTMESVEDCTRGFKAFMGTIDETTWVENPHF